MNAEPCLSHQPGSRPRGGWLWSVLALLLVPGLVAGCKKESTGLLPGYVEGEYVYVAAPLSGQMTALPVTRGQDVAAGAPLFALEDAAEHAARDEAAKRLTEAEATLTDLRKGLRPSELDAKSAALTKAEAALAFAEKQVARQQDLAATKAGTVDDLDRVRSEAEQGRSLVAQLRAELATAQLGAREDQIAAAQAMVAARQAVLAGTEWNLAQKRQAAPLAGLVFDTFYQTGEWIAAGKPVVAILPPANIKVRTFLPEAKAGSVHSGEKVSVHIDGRPAPVEGTVSFIAPQAEYSPPVIYSRDIREKLVYLVEIRFREADAVTLHPGQPVDVDFSP